MIDPSKGREQLLAENEELRRRLADMEAADHNRRRLENDLDLTFRLSPMLMCIAGFDGYLKRANPVYQETCGYTQEEVLTLPYSESMHPDDRDAFHAVVGQLANGMPVFNVETRMRRPDESVRLVRWTGIPMTEAGTVLCIGQDITATKEAEEALQNAHDELEQRVTERTAELSRANEVLAIFRKFAEASGEGFGMSDFDGRIVYVNPMLCRLFGEENPEDVIGQVVSRYYPKEYVQRRESEMIPALLREGYCYAEQPVLPHHGTPIQTSQSTFLIRDENGNPFRIAVVISDITARKRAEETLAESEEKYRQLIETTDTGYLILDSEGRVVDANAEYVQLTGHRTLSEIMGRRVEEWTAPNEAERNMQEVQKCLATGTVRQLEVGYRGRNGKVTPIEINATVITTRQGRQILSLCRDITERKQAEVALRQSHDELRTIYDGMVDGLHILNLETLKPVRANSALCRMMGYSEEEILLLGFSDVHPPDQLSRIQEEFRARLEERAFGWPDVPLVRKDGSVFYADITGSQIVYNGTPCLMCFFRDITDRKKTQEALERERQSLWKMLQASDHERQIISYEIHDGLAQYLAAAGMQFQVFDAIRESNPEAAKKAYDAARQLVSQSHFEARRLISEVRPPVIDEIGLETAITHLVHEHRRHGGPKIECHSSVQFGRLTPILENALYRIVQEALTNACKHSKSKTVTVTLTQKGQDVRLEVRDWGIGFDPDSVGKGHFGLEGIRQRVRLLGGRLAIESTPDSGTLIQVVVPIVERQSEQ